MQIPVKGGVQEMAEGNAESSWRLVWSDEFSGAGGSAPDPGKWGYDTGGTGWGNNEKQYYTDSTNNAYLDGDGHLVIKAMKETREGMPYTSARLVSKNKGDWTYGRIEVRAKLPSRKGLWPRHLDAPHRLGIRALADQRRNRHDGAAGL